MTLPMDPEREALARVPHTRRDAGQLRAATPNYDAWRLEWEQKHAHRWAPYRGRLIPKAPNPVTLRARGPEPHSASVIRALEVQINGRGISPGLEET